LPEHPAGICRMTAYMSSNGARIILVESASRFSRDLIVQETKYQYSRSWLHADRGRSGRVHQRHANGSADPTDPGSGVAIRKGVAGCQAGWCAAAQAAGHRTVRRPEAGPEAARILAQTLRAEGLTLRAIAARLGRRVFYHRPANLYKPESVKRMLASPSTPLRSMHSPPLSVPRPANTSLLR